MKKGIKKPTTKTVFETVNDIKDNIKIAESEFEKNMITIMRGRGWCCEQFFGTPTVLEYRTPEELEDNFAKCIYHNNRQDSRLGSYPLTKTETKQCIEKIVGDEDPCTINSNLKFGFITITRDNKDDINNYGKDVVLEILPNGVSGNTFFQIAVQTRFKKKRLVCHDRRGDVTLLMNGMPVIHIEEKANGVDVHEAEEQIRRYIKEGVFTGLFACVQMFVAMSEHDVLYAANPGIKNVDNVRWYRWLDKNNKEIKDYKKILYEYLSIPTAHEIIKLFSIADSMDNTLKIARSYQIDTCREIFELLRVHDWRTVYNKSGFVFSATGSGKTMETYMAAFGSIIQDFADKAIILLDRIELTTQTTGRWTNFADYRVAINTTENTKHLASLMAADDKDKSIIVTSIQKCSNLNSEYRNQKQLEKARTKRIVFFIDEAHRSIYGKMIHNIRVSFPNAVIIGFTGTPILEGNSNHEDTTEKILGPELSRYTQAEAIRDKNVLGFEAVTYNTLDYVKLREAIACREAGVASEDDIDTQEKRKVFDFYMNRSTFPVCGHFDDDGNYIKGMEDCIPTSQYECDEHRKKVAENVYKSIKRHSHKGKYHQILAANSIQEAFEYYKILKNDYKDINVVGIWDSNTDYNTQYKTKEEDLCTLLEDYAKISGIKFTLARFKDYKDDVISRLSKPNGGIDLVIVINQLLTGFDSKYINVLHLDRFLTDERLIQAFSRTNRICDDDKPNGIIYCYRKVYTQEKEINKAFDAYTNGNPVGIFVDKMPENLKSMNKIFENIKNLFETYEIKNFSKVPEDESAQNMFMTSFYEFNRLLKSVWPQGFSWDENEYKFPDYAKKDIDGEDVEEVVSIDFTKKDYDILSVRYNEIYEASKTNSSNNTPSKRLPYDIDYTIIEAGSVVINAGNINIAAKTMSDVADKASEEQFNNLLQQFCSQIAGLKGKHQNQALALAHKIRKGKLKLDENKNFLDYVNEAVEKEKRKEIKEISNGLGINFDALLQLINLNLKEETIADDYEYKKLKDSIDLKKAQIYLKKTQNREYKKGEIHSAAKVRSTAQEVLRNAVLTINKKY